MKKILLIIIHFAILASFALLVGTASAQDVDVDSMSNEELMVLLQSIMQKLEQEMATETEGKDPETVISSVPTSSPAGTAEQEPDQETETFSVYTNKKLVYDSLPDYMFVRKPTGGSDGSQPDNGTTGGTHTFEFHYGDYTFTLDIPEDTFGDIGIPTDVWNAW